MWQFAYPIGKRLPPAARAFMDFARVHTEVLLRGVERPLPAAAPTEELMYT